MTPVPGGDRGGYYRMFSTGIYKKINVFTPDCHPDRGAQPSWAQGLTAIPGPCLPGDLQGLSRDSNLTSGAEIREGLWSTSPIDVPLHPRVQATAAGQRKLLSVQSPLCACTSVTDFAYWGPAGHRAAAPHRSLLAIHLHLAPVSSAAMKATGPDNAQTQVSPPGRAPSVEDPTGSWTVSGPHKDRPHPFLSRPKPPTRTSSALPLKTNRALKQKPWQLPSLHPSQG
ncbi:LOW QUALITY PROTEIN: transcription factor NF-E4-like [Macaca thibetana thibetana]|uniref:LOW QUALITY PROTEIN: transcription factor NF-E4-like n=1 Tax=Macaca thibetana thibetana TaxID=257877 RepID=UPI0021BC6550|nr:LOW QUALITY PROTEIN: transcription factor NF-E4-like [Macaca thibetana thibetana]